VHESGDDLEPFRAMEAAFDRALTARPEMLHQGCFRFGGLPVRLRLLGGVLARHVERPFAHLTLESSEIPPSLKIDLWDASETGTASSPEATLPSGGQRWSVDDGVLAASHDGRFLWFERDRTQTCLDRREQRIVGWVAAADQLTLYERGKPLHLLLSVWYRDQGIQIVHAGLVGRDGRGVLFPGAGAAGKSTCALACAGSGFDYLGDDYVGFALAADSFKGYSLYGTARLDPGHLARFPALATHAVPPEPPHQLKSLLFLPEVFRVQAEIPISAIALPRITSRMESSVIPANKREALRAVLPSSVFFLVPSPGVRGADRLASLIQGVPTYWLEIGQELRQIPERVSELLDACARAGR
jgi:hypothetical protein